MKKAVFLDRDGVIVKNINGEAPTKVSALELTTGTVSLILGLQKKRYKIVVVSNQPDVALGKINEEIKKGLVKKFSRLLKQSNVSVNGIYYCFHHPSSVIKKYSKDCNCRKPKPGMFLKAIHDHKILVGGSYIVGDRASDIKAGSLIGLKTILIDPENSEVNYLSEYKVSPDFIIKKLSDILDII